MTPLSRLLAFFPVFHGLMAFGLAITSLASLCREEYFAFGAWALISVSALYLLPPFLFRIHESYFPLREGFSRIDSGGEKSAYSPWWGSHQLQGLYIALPGIENALNLIPGAYSAWLRLWGAEVGRGVYWTPRVEILDRPLVCIGDHVVFGHRTTLCSHVIMRKRDGLRLYVKKIKIGRECLIGADSQLGPGVHVFPGTELPYATMGRINQAFEKEAVHE